MKIEVKIFAAVRDIAGRDAVIVDLPEKATVADVRAALRRQYPEAAGLLQSASFAIDHEYAADGASVSVGREVACIPPVSGG